jgi:hypothetical protein
MAKSNKVNHPPRRRRTRKTPSQPPVKIKALDVYKAYPHSDLLFVTVPDKGMTIARYLEVCGKELEACGDTLFLFILRELSDARGEVHEGMGMIQQAIYDLEAVRDGIGDLE